MAKTRFIDIDMKSPFYWQVGFREGIAKAEYLRKLYDKTKDKSSGSMRADALYYGYCALRDRAEECVCYAKAEGTLLFMWIKE